MGICSERRVLAIYSAVCSYYYYYLIFTAQVGKYLRSGFWYTRYLH